MRHLYWFQNDLRLHDNPALLEHLQASQLLLVFLWPRNRPWCNQHGIGAQRERFLTESLISLREDLARLGQDLLVLHGSPELVIPDLVRRFGIERVGTARTPGWYEAAAVRTLRDKLDIPVQVHRGNTLFAETALPFPLTQMPGQFTPFRRAVEDLPFTAPTPAPGKLPPPPAADFHAIPVAAARPSAALPIRGGAAAGARRLQQFVHDEQGILSYKETRNGLDPLDGSSTLSPWLATGCLSPRQVAQEVADFEAAVTSNASTYWLYFELLWREFFHWRALTDDARHLFRASGAGKRLMRCTFEPRNFARWCQGDTNFPLVNAFMHQLVDTGWMSNRGRQIVASCLVHEYGIDWRYGAAFFEHHLLDFDVASNYGNWQYLAGVGADPRGGRRFNQDKQRTDHDSDGRFVAKWDGDRPHQPTYVTDAADWPI
ncbi:DASH family cryptochrome [Chromatocurvus halotolerans]|uniref:Cryptochrome DASH n=1 Tax=Chromatocurvus halotolerans TaxID=1132028 RepID=A0A4R2KM71_9GAMM|nr:DASH family cryptochrome [Chromatocurvus halotolerans]TCO74524.1 deoxyribodipyrimidine photo-lyase (single-stranded DNA-specific) [Chromatocurvus halotolerans]